jgi:hypothetical protein
MIYRFNNLHFKHDNRDYLASGQATYSIDDYGDDEKEAGFDDVALTEVIGSKGVVPDKDQFKDAVIITLNRDERLCRMLAL